MRLSFFSGRFIKHRNPPIFRNPARRTPEAQSAKQRKTRNMSDKVIHLNSSNFDATIASDKPVLVDFWAPWCGPCRMLGPTIDELAETVGGSALICKLNVDESPDIAAKIRRQPDSDHNIFQKFQAPRGVRNGDERRAACKAESHLISARSENPPPPRNGAGGFFLPEVRGLPAFLRAAQPRGNGRSGKFPHRV